MKRDKFVSLAEARTNKALKQIRLIGNLSNRAAYEYSEDEVKAIFGALEAEIKNCKTKFENSTHESLDAAFSLS